MTSSDDEYRHEIALARSTLAALADAEPHWAEYLAAWREESAGG